MSPTYEKFSPCGYPDYARAFLAWLEFEVDCERFDRELPGFWFRVDEWIPAPGGPRSESIAFARQRRERFRQQTRGVDVAAKRDAGHAVRRMSYVAQIKALEQIRRNPL